MYRNCIGKDTKKARHVNVKIRIKIQLLWLLAVGRVPEGRNRGDRRRVRWFGFFGGFFIICMLIFKLTSTEALWLSLLTFYW